MSFCHFCWKEAKKIQEELDLMTQHCLDLEREKEGIFQHMTALENSTVTNIAIFPKNKQKIIRIIKEPLVARNMTENEANNYIRILTKENNI